MDPLQNAKVKQYVLKHSLPQIYQALLTASCLSSPNDPIQFLENKLVALQGHHNLHDIDWYTFAHDAENQIAKTSLTRGRVRSIFKEAEDSLPTYLLEKVYSCYRRHLTKYCFRQWVKYITQRKRKAYELHQKMRSAGEHYGRKRQGLALTSWISWLGFRKSVQAAVFEKLQKVFNGIRFKRIITIWSFAVKESKRTKEYLETLDKGVLEMSDQAGEGCDSVSVLPGKLSNKIFQYLELRDLLKCELVCSTWRAITQSGHLWSRVNFSVEKDWITDLTVKEILQKYRPFVTNLNLRGCTSLTWLSLTCINKCRNLQDVNVSECSNITDMMVQSLVEACPNLLYLNLSCTPVTNEVLRALSRSSLSLQYLSLAYCQHFTDKGLKYLTTGKGCHDLVHLNLSGCTQMTVDGFRYISTGCPSLKEIVINDMATLSDRCVVGLIAQCSSLCALSLLDTPHLSDAAFKAIAEVSKLKAFSTEGNGRITDSSWKALCHSSPGLRRLHAAECPRMTDACLKSVATLKNLNYLDISHCNKVSDVGVRFLTEGSAAAKLRELNLSHCSRIRDISVMRIAQKMLKLFHLNLSHCSSLTNSSLECLTGSRLCSLDLSGCSLQDQGLGALEGVCLRRLVLSQCVHITDVGVEKLLKRLRDLGHLDVSHCVGLSDNAIKALSFYCRALVSLRMAGCPKMTDVALQYLTAGLRYLRELDVSGCVRLSDRSVRLLERICPPLGSVTLAYCCGISKTAALRLKPRVKCWVNSVDDPPLWFGYNNMGQMLEPIKSPSQSDVTGRQGEPAEETVDEESSKLT
ncbi:dynein regulatory complex subunit 6 [Gadus morhua]|nr:dynein regulatory complex subunit 6 [Gadus morhua]